MIIGHGQHMKAMIRTFAEYEEGFTVGEESWLGLKQLAELTKVVVKSLKTYNLKVCIDTTFGRSSIIHKDGEWELKVEFTSWGGQQTKTATYSRFSVGPAPRFKSPPKTKT